MKKYDVYPINVNDDFMWEVYEIESEHVIGRFFFEDDAIKSARFMERGGGFDGFTPTFILIPVAAPRDINLEFSNLVLSE